MASVKAALVLQGGALFPDQAKGKRLGVTRFYWEARDPQLSPIATRNVLADMRKAGWEIGLMRDPNWEGYSDTPEQWAKRFSDDLPRLNVAATQQCALMADIETHDEDYVFRALSELRKLRPGRGLVWCPESFQGGWFSQRLVDLINGDRMLTVAPQHYKGDMTPRAGDGAALNLIDAKIARAKILGFYGCATVGPDQDAKGELIRRYTNPPDDWDGFLYDFGNVRG